MTGIGRFSSLLAGLALAVTLPSASLSDVLGEKRSASGPKTVLVPPASPSQACLSQALRKQSSDAQLCTSSEDVFAAIERERMSLEEQRMDLAERRATLELAREQLDLEADRLASLRDEIEALLLQVEAAQTADLERLVRIYQNMDPQEAAVIMADLDMETTVMVLGSMSERAAAPILVNLDPTRARAISRIFLERSKLPADQDFSDLRLQ